MKSFIVALVIAIILTFNSGCAPIILGTAATSVIISSGDKSVTNKLHDIQIWNSLKGRYNDSSVKLSMQDISIIVHNGKVLLIGNVPDYETKMKAVDLAWEINNVVQVIDNINVGPGSGVKGYVKDVYITTKIKATLSTTRGIRSVNYTLETVNGVVYILGSAKSAKELDKVINIIQNIAGNSNVVSYIVLKSRKK